MNLSEPFIRRPAMTTLLTVSAILFGIVAYRQLAVNDLPVVDYPVITVNVNYPGASPQTVAANIATPLERQFMQISGLELVTSQSSQGTCSLTLQFNLNKSLDGAATDVQTAITQATGNLPADLPSPPTFSKNNPNDQPIIYLALASDSMTQGDLYDFAKTQVGEQITILPGVSNIVIYGSQSAVRIKANPSALAARNWTLNDLSDAITHGTTYQGAGQFDGPHRTFILQPQGQLENAAQYNNLIIGQSGGSPIYLRDVATAKDSVQDERIRLSFHARGHTVPNAVCVVGVFRQAGSNAVEVSKSIRALLPRMKSQIPASVTVVPIYDRSLTIANSVMDVQATLVIAFLLVVAVIFVFLGRVTDTLIPVVALPLSLLITFIVMNVLGYSLDNLSLMALTLAIGFLVDDAIVFLENTVRRMEHGEAVLTATLNSAREISFTILSMTLSLAAVFIPLVFMPGLIGRIFREFSITIIVAILASGAVSLTLTPMMCSRMLGKRGKENRTLMERMAGAVEHRVLNVYGRTLWFFIHHKWISVIIWIVCLGGTGWFFNSVKKSFLPIGDSSFIRGVCIAQTGSSYHQMREYQQRIDAAVQQDPDVDVSFTGSGVTGFLPSNFCFTLAFLKDPALREHKAPIAEVTQRLIGRIFMSTVGVFPALSPTPVLQISVGAASQLQGEFSYSISGIDPQQTYAAAFKVLGAMAQHPEIFANPNPDAFLNAPELRIDILREKAASYGVSPQKIEALLRSAYSQNYVYLIKRPNDQYQVILEANDQERARPEDLSVLYVKSDDGTHLVPLSAVARWSESIGPQSVNHLNQFTAVTISFNVAPKATIGQATDFINAQVLPPGIRGDLQGEAKQFIETARAMIVLGLLAVFVMYVILGILYESYVHPITVLSSLPVALVGGLATLYLFNEEASLYAYVGMFLLMGIVKKNGIMLVDFALQRIAEGQDRAEAIHEASMDRFRPIIMTTLAALMGAVPIALGYGADGASRRPLGLVIVGGLIVSQLITLYVTPGIYLYLEAFQERVLDKTSFFHSVRTRHGSAVPVDPDGVSEGDVANAMA